jgi:hypothetical protein
MAGLKFWVEQLVVELPRYPITPPITKDDDGPRPHRRITPCAAPPLHEASSVMWSLVLNNCAYLRIVVTYFKCRSCDNHVSGCIKSSILRTRPTNNKLLITGEIATQLFR